jgi:Mg2+/citrate symporter
MAALGIGILIALVIAAIVTTDERERLERLMHQDACRREAERRHPANYVDPLDEAVQMTKPRTVAEEAAAYLAGKAAGR